MVEKLAEACRLLDDVYWRQSDLEGLALYKSTRDPVLKDLLYIMGSRLDLLDENKPFTGAAPMPPGHELYPARSRLAPASNSTSRSIPRTRKAIYDPFTVVKWNAQTD